MIDILLLLAVCSFIFCLLLGYVRHMQKEFNKLGLPPSRDAGWKPGMRPFSFEISLQDRKTVVHVWDVPRKILVGEDELGFPDDFFIHWYYKEIRKHWMERNNKVIFSKIAKIKRDAVIEETRV